MSAKVYRLLYRDGERQLQRRCWEGPFGIDGGFQEWDGLKADILHMYNN